MGSKSDYHQRDTNSIGDFQLYRNNTGGLLPATTSGTVDVYSPTVTLSGTTTISENAVGTVDITATLSSITYQDVTINLSFTGTASGVDYNASTISILIPAGSLSGKITIDPIDDTIVELNETIIVDIKTITGGCVTEDGVQSATVTITDDDSSTVTIADASIAEGGDLSFPITLSNAYATAITLTFSYTNTTASGSDYTQTATITIPAGDTTATLIVP